MSGDPRDYKLDIESLRDSLGDDAASSESKSKDFIGVHFKCCGVYQRIYKSDDGTRYEGRCPKCARPVRFLIGRGGTDERTFVVE